MDDPWGDAAKQEQILALPGRAHLAASGGDSVLLARDTAAAWYALGEDQVWSAGHDSRLCKTAGAVSPGPWAGVSPLETASQDAETLPADSEAIDSAISLGDNDAHNGFAVHHVLSPLRAWEEDAPVEVEAAAQIEAQDCSSSDSSQAVAETRQPAKVLERVDIYQDMARQLLTDLKAPHGPPTLDSRLDRGTHQVTRQDDSAQDALPTTGEQQVTTPTTLKTPPEASVSFSIDLSHLDSIFPTCPAPPSPPPAEPLPTSIPQDSFTTVAERKAWYRISRLGSLRKHRDAKDDSYVRVRWAGSQVREHTLDIVRRWKDEDTRGQSKSGVRSGGGAVGFNWDVVSPPVEIGKLLQQERRLRHEARRNELAEQKMPTRPPSVTPFAEGDASFHSSSNMAAVDAPPLEPALPSITSVANGHHDSNDDDDDEEWSEMVTMPTEAAPVFEQLEQTDGQPKSTATCIPPNASTIMDPIPKTEPMIQTQLEQTVAHETSASWHQNLMPEEQSASTAPTQPSVARGLASQEATCESVLLDGAVAAIMETLPDLSYMLR
ncbi:hypothetical protein CDD81_5982 [Ophiocordyceps australis]|uniref:Uncharacterized protein n=1 Tax=Ophiocordyceps australis TaxID=1399860 RepID=A0A2C5Y921_9HYPO|nr:hypothetical protein CDD81_5982 [Ophiocordyceps australis]